MADRNGRQTILITGATGKVGRSVVEFLKADDSLDLRAGVRSPDKAAELGIPAVWLDFDRPDSLAPALDGANRVFLATGYTVDMLRQSKVFVDTARRNPPPSGPRHIVHLGACGGDDTQVPHWAWHQLVERYIEWAGLGFTHLRPEFFMQNMLGYGNRSPIVDGVIEAYVGDARASWVDCDDVAAVAAECLRDPARHAGQTYRLGYDSKSYGEIAALLTEVVGRPFSYRSRPPEDFLASMERAGSEPAYMRSVYQSHIDAATGAIRDPDPVFDDFPAIVGRPPVTWKEFAVRHRARFGG